MSLSVNQLRLSYPASSPGAARPAPAHLPHSPLAESASSASSEYRLLLAAAGGTGGTGSPLGRGGGNAPGRRPGAPGEGAQFLLPDDAGMGDEEWILANMSADAIRK